MINVQIEKNQNESDLSTLKRFTRKVQESGVLPRVRSIRYAERTKSPYVKKKNKLKSLARKAEFEKLVKLGKAVERRGR